MPRVKVKIAYIEQREARKASWKKRKASLFKKLEELCTLCGTEGCAILYNPFDPTRELWPNYDDVMNVLGKFMAESEMSRRKKMLDLESYTRERIKKVKVKIKKQNKVNRELELTIMMFECFSGKLSLGDLNPIDFKDFMEFTDYKISGIDERIQFLKTQAPAPPPPESQIPQLLDEVVGGSNTANNLVMENQLGDLDEIQTTTDWYPNISWLDTCNLVEHDMGVELMIPSFDNLDPFGHGMSSS
uniref:agamous-like MADS-box protein AGL80 n=1 Tax=Erigeron canadensis TaxID=72917 RepID=UPI001CB99CE2|nr:agamous-like MADS-box protein AGL80 [Erigeron canadensis]